ncbi:hypothetical protein FIBSPDRAFT_725944, partial [Athelia psychrophila]
KDRTLYLLSEGYIPDDICDIFGVSECSLYRWRANFAAHGSVIPPWSYTPHQLIQGWPRILNADHTHDLLTLIEEAPSRDWVALAHDAAIGHTTVHNIIQNCGVTYKLLRRAAAERDEELRQDWRADMQANIVASQIVTMDETSKDDHTLYHHYSQAPAGEHATIDANFVCGERFSMVAALSVDAMLQPELFLTCSMETSSSISL